MVVKTACVWIKSYKQYDQANNLIVPESAPKRSSLLSGSTAIVVRTPRNTSDFNLVLL